jgi:hypothetical protein
MLLDENFFSFKDFKGNASFVKSLKRSKPLAEHRYPLFKKVSEMGVNIMKSFDFNEEIMSDTIPI